MSARLIAPPLIETDETAWLETTARLVAAARWGDIDGPALSEYLTDMAKRDRREVHSRLGVLLTHLLKWEYQPDKSGAGWEATIKLQRKELALLLDSGTLRRHAEAILPAAYRWATDQAATETGLPEATFPVDCPYSLDQAVGIS